MRIFFTGAGARKSGVPFLLDASMQPIAAAPLIRYRAAWSRFRKGSLYPARRRLENRDLPAADWKARGRARGQVLSPDAGRAETTRNRKPELIVYKRGYGSANLDYNTSLSLEPRIRFRLPKPTN
jgi:hypothetical protein